MKNQNSNVNKYQNSKQKEEEKEEKFIQNINGKDKELKKLLLQFKKRITEQIEWTNVNQIIPPFINGSFAHWRKCCFEKYDTSLKEQTHKRKMFYYHHFHKIMTGQLKIYSEKIRQPYIREVEKNQLNIPACSKEKIKIKKGNKQINGGIKILARIIAEWSVQVELAEDLIVECILYGFLDSKENEEQYFYLLLQILQSLLLQYELDQTTKCKKTKLGLSGLSKRVLSYTLKLAKDNIVKLFKENAITFNKITWGTGMTILYALLGKTLPWTTVIASIQIPYIIGGYVMPQVIGKVYNKFFENKFILKEIKNLREIFEVMNMNLRKFTQDIRVTVDECFKTEDEEELEFITGCLQIKINNLLSSNFDQNIETAPQDFQDLIVKSCQEPELESWFQVSKGENEEFDQQEIEDSFILVNVKNKKHLKEVKK